MESEPQIVRAILRQNEFLFRRHLVLSRTVLDEMKTNGLVTDITRRKIMGAPAHQQVPVLLNSLQHTGIHSLRKFLDVLKRTGHGWMVDHILDTDVTVGGPGKSKDDIGYRDRYQPAYTRPQAQLSAFGNRGLGYDPQRTDLRKSMTAGVLQQQGGISLASLLKAREPVDQPDTEPRGTFHARTLLTDPIATGPSQQWSGPSYGGGQPFGQQSYVQLPGLPSYNQQSSLPPMSNTSQIPMTLYGLNQAFASQNQQNQQALSVLRQEEIAIRQLAEQNMRDQGHVRRNQAAVQDIVHRLQDIHTRAKEVYEPAPHPNIGRYRLAQLNQIPWSIGR